MSKQIQVGLFGSQGYVGKELISLLAHHPHLQLAGIFGRNAPQGWATDLDVILLATPPEVSMELVTQFQGQKVKIIDLSGAFRLPAQEFSQWYGVEHTAAEFLPTVQYGLSPWGMSINHDTTLIANPGCYATCALMSLLPLIKNGIIKTDAVIIDAKSGVSGAGKKVNEDLMFCEMAENFFPYKIGKHQHLPEIKNALHQYTGQACDLTFVTHMLPIIRGISMSIYAQAEKILVSDEEISAAIDAAFSEAYGQYPLATFAEINQGNVTQDKMLLSLKSVVGTPGINIGYFVQSGKVIIFSSIDNLLKGAASQAIENINAIYGFPLATGLRECNL